MFDFYEIQNMDSYRFCVEHYVNEKKTSEKDLLKHVVSKSLSVMVIFCSCIW